MRTSIQAGDTVDRHRRRVIAGSVAVLAFPGLGFGGCAGAPRGRFEEDPFTLGVASGDPWPDGVVIWTRLAPDPLAGGGMAPRPVPVTWQVADDEGFARIVRHGTAIARPEDAHSVHVEVAGLAPARWYFYRFIAGGAVSPVGRTRTAPAPGSEPGEARFALAACQNYESGYYNAYAAMSGDDLDFVLHAGDYIYEGGGRKSWFEPVRAYPERECVTLADYRARYALYKSDPDLRRAHAAFPFIHTYDDHEVVNNWAADRGPRDTPRERFLARRAAAFKAYWEHLPLRQAQRPSGAAIRLYRRLEYGRLLSLNICDTRLYRTALPCGGGTVAPCAGAFDPTAQMLGPAQERWLMAGLRDTPARWNAIVQGVPMIAFDRDVHPDIRRFSMDKWDGYRVPRSRLLGFLGRLADANAVSLAGDIHRHLAGTLRADAARPEAPAVASEFVTTSISSGGSRHRPEARIRAWIDQNPGIDYILDRRGYVRCAVRPGLWRTDFRVVDDVARRGVRARTAATYVVEAGRAGVLRA